MAYMEFVHESGLDPTAFPSLLKFESELASMAATHVGGDSSVVGNFSSGGTESIILATKACRDYYRAKKPEIKEPEMVLPVTAHAAFHKAAHYLGLKIVHCKVDPTTFKADVESFKSVLTPNTIMAVGSAPSYANGVVDPIGEMAAAAQERGIWFHSDACMGGFMLPYLRRLGEPVPPFGFDVPGVTSLSMDLHKYAYTPKNASLVLYRNTGYRHYQLYACSNWTGYTIINNAVQSSKSGGPVAAAWAVVNFIGDDGYLELARKTWEATKRVVAAVDAIDDLYTLGRPEFCLTCFASDTVNVFHVADEMKLRGWFIQPQLAFDCSPKNVHVSINAKSLETVDAMTKDLAECVEIAKQIPTGDMADQIRTAFADVDPADFTEEAFQNMLGMAGMNGVDVPERMAEINEVLNALPVPLREKLLVEFLNQLYTVAG